MILACKIFSKCDSDWSGEWDPACPWSPRRSDRRSGPEGIPLLPRCNSCPAKHRQSRLRQQCKELVCGVGCHQKPLSSPAQPAIPLLVTKLLTPRSVDKADLHPTTCHGPSEVLGAKSLGLFGEDALLGVSSRGHGNMYGFASLCQGSWDEG